ncbi:MAG: ribose-5-phosphate isomerase RpiA, partial [Candidatus Hadarchaeales archaeon]
MNPIEQAKYNAAKEAITYIKNGMIIGLGTGSTANKAMELLAEKIREDKLDIICIATSKKTEQLAKDLKLELTTLDQIEKIDITIDGADEVDPRVNLIKGKGGALTREKILLRAARKVVIVIDETKLVRRLGEKNPVPVEVFPFAVEFASKRLERLGGAPELRKKAGKPVLTDNGNYIIDVWFDGINEPSRLEREINEVPGVVENGIFTVPVDLLIIGGREGVKVVNCR